MMIIGNGLLASAFDPVTMERFGVTVFASGVSNSSETRPEAFERERRLLAESLARRREGPFVYFSTCSIADHDRKGTPYVGHKLAMEALVASEQDHLIFRLPQVVGARSNQHTLSNFLANSIRTGTRFSLWDNAVRCLIDVEHVALIATHLATNRLELNRTLDIAPPETVTLRELVEMMASVLRLEASYASVDRGGGSVPDSGAAMQYGPGLGVDFSQGYTYRLIKKYYASHVD